MTFCVALLLPSLLIQGDAAAGAARVTVNQIRVWTHAGYTRVVIDLSGPATYKEKLLAADPSLKKGRRLYFDIEGASLGEGMGEPIPIGDGLLQAVRAAQHRPDVVRVVLDIEAIESHKVFPLPGPDRIVVDVRGKKRPRRSVEAGTETKGKSKDKEKAAAKSRTVRTVVIDPGHGGKDPGALGSCGLKEKALTLEIARRLHRRLDGRKGVRAFLTRNGDRYLSLEERTSIANAKDADIFVSIHINASTRRDARGIETYYLDQTSDRATRTIAARENFTTEVDLDELQYILADLLVEQNVRDSSQLARLVQTGMVRDMGARYSGVRDLGVKTALFFVLVGAEMPAVLVEVSFITNPVECKRLKSDTYLDRAAKAIEQGILTYLEKGGGAA